MAGTSGTEGADLAAKFVAAFVRRYYRLLHAGDVSALATQLYQSPAVMVSHSGFGGPAAAGPAVGPAAAATHVREAHPPTRLDALRITTDTFHWDAASGALVVQITGTFETAEGAQAYSHTAVFSRTAGGKFVLNHDILQASAAAPAASPAAAVPVPAPAAVEAAPAPAPAPAPVVETATPPPAAPLSPSPIAAPEDKPKSAPKPKGGAKPAAAKAAEPAPAAKPPSSYLVALGGVEPAPVPAPTARQLHGGQARPVGQGGARGGGEARDAREPREARPVTEVFLRGVNAETDVSALRRALGAFGTVSRMGAPTNLAKGFIFATFSDAAGAQAAAAAGSLTLDGTRVVIELRDKSRRGGRRGGGGGGEGGERREGGDRSRREGGDRSRREGGDRPRREGGDRPRREGGDRSRREGGDRPRREGGDRPRREGGDRPSGERGGRGRGGERRRGGRGAGGAPAASD